MSRLRYILIFAICLFSCKNPTNSEEQASSLVQKWIGREIIFPANLLLTSLNRDTIQSSKTLRKYTIVSYVDSIGCLDCKLRFPQWKTFVKQLKSTYPDRVSVLFFLHSKNQNELLHILKRDQFDYPICIDEDDSFGRLNNFPSDIDFQTFMLDINNKVVAIGNPIYNSQIRTLYLEIIHGGKLDNNLVDLLACTKVHVGESSVMLGQLDRMDEPEVIFTLKNIGNKPLLIENVDVSCDCTLVSYSKEPTDPGKEIELEVIYKPDQPGYFNKTIAVYCNAEISPINLTIRGYVK